MKKTFRILVFLFTVCAAAAAQVVPAATGPGSRQGTLPLAAIFNMPCVTRKRVSFLLAGLT